MTLHPWQLEVQNRCCRMWSNSWKLVKGHKRKCEIWHNNQAEQYKTRCADGWIHHSIGDAWADASKPQTLLFTELLSEFFHRQPVSMVLLVLISLILPVLSQIEMNEDTTMLRPGYGMVFWPEGQIVFNVNELSLLLEIPLAKFSEQDSVPNIFDPLIDQCKQTNDEDNAYDLCVRLLAELDMTATHSYQAMLTLQQELDNVKMFYPEICLGLDCMNIPQQFLKIYLTWVFQKEWE